LIMLYIIPIRNIPADKAAITVQFGSHGSVGIFLIGISIIKNKPLQKNSAAASLLSDYIIPQ
jgi:hypothetical protein